MSGKARAAAAVPAARVRRSRWALAALGAYAALLVAFRPATPLEWDEVLAQRGVLRYDVAAHSPQPPGFPAFIGAAKAVDLVVGDPLLALQAVVIASALAAVAGTWVLARRLGAPAAVATGAAAVVAANPEFLFAAGAGISDVPGTAAAVLAVLALVAAAGDPALLPVAGAVCAAALGIRPQVLAVLLPAAAWAVAGAARARRWGRLALAAVAATAVSAAVWLPAILVTGARRWWWATADHLRYIAAVERSRHLPGADLLDVVRHWFLGSFAGWPFAVPLWLLAAAGAFVLVRRGLGRAALLGAATTAGYLGFASFTMNETVSMRYMLPATPALAILAAGGLASARAAVRRTAGAVLVLWCAAAAAWTWPALRQRLKPEPVWAALTWVREHFDPADTRVVYDGVMRPHAEYVLGARGFALQSVDEAKLFGEGGRPPVTTLFVTPRPAPGGELLFEARHETGRVARLAWGRYGSCAVTRMRRESEPVLSPTWRRGPDGWRLSGTGWIRLPVGAAPVLARVCAGTGTLAVGASGATPERVSAGGCALLPLLPGGGGGITVEAPPGTEARLPPVELVPLRELPAGAGLASAYMVPQVAHADGREGAFWRTDLVLVNPQTHPLRVGAAFLPTASDNRVAAWFFADVPPRTLLELPDVLARRGFAGRNLVGAMILAAGGPAGACRDGGCAFLVLARTFNGAATAGQWPAAEWLPGVPAEHALRAGEQAVFAGLSSGHGVRTTVGVASWTAAALRARVRVLAPDGTPIDDRREAIPAFGHVRLDLSSDVRGGCVEVQLDGAPSDAMVVPYVAMVDDATGLPAYRLADNAPGRAAPQGWEPPLPRARPRR